MLEDIVPTKESSEVGANHLKDPLVHSSMLHFDMLNKEYVIKSAF